MYMNILVPIDLAHPELAEPMLTKAKSLLADGGRMLVLNVGEDIPAYVAAEISSDIRVTALENSKAELRALIDAQSVTADIVMRDGAPARTILEIAKDRECDLIVIASRQPSLTGFLMGTTASRVVNHAECSVLVMR